MSYIVQYVHRLPTACIYDEDLKSDIVPARNPLPILRRFRYIFLHVIPVAVLNVFMLQGLANIDPKTVIV